MHICGLNTNRINISDDRIICNLLFFIVQIFSYNTENLKRIVYEPSFKKEKSSIFNSKRKKIPKSSQCRKNECKKVGKWTVCCSVDKRHQTKMKTEMSRSYNLWIRFQKLCLTSYVSFENIDKHREY